MEKSSFFLNADIETLISSVETTVINELEGGNRQAGMKRLKVPPLSEKVAFGHYLSFLIGFFFQQNAATAFSLGIFTGVFIVLAALIIFASFGAPKGGNEPKWVAVRLFRGFFLLFLSLWLYGLNM